WGYLVRKGRTLVNREVSHDEEVRRIAVFWGLIATTSVILYIIASFLPNQDGACHQTAGRDTARPPPATPRSPRPPSRCSTSSPPSGSPSRSAPACTAATGCPRSTGPRRASPG